jgi:hypothetical protein
MAENPTTTRVTINWGESELPEAQRRRWLGAWILDLDGTEGDFFYDGPGGQPTSHDAPEDAVGIRLRWWPSPDAEDVGHLHNAAPRQPTLCKPILFDKRSNLTYDVNVLL